MSLKIICRFQCVLNVLDYEMTDSRALERLDRWTCIFRLHSLYNVDICVSRVIINNGLKSWSVLCSFAVDVISLLQGSDSAGPVTCENEGACIW